METSYFYLNAAQQRAHLVHPKDYRGVLGRASGKSQRIIAERSSRLCYEMPGATFGLYADSYANAMANLVPNIIKGWEEMGYIENIHFVVEKAPPTHFGRMLFKPKVFKHTIIWHTGTIFVIISDDRPIGANGRSLQHLFGDEIRLVSYNKMKQSVFPAIRGERLRFGNVPQFQGTTFTTDMPEYQAADWIMEQEASMDTNKILRIMQVALYYDKLRFEYLKAKSEKTANQRLLNKYLVELSLIEKSLNELRKDSLFFDIASTFINVEAIGLDAIKNFYNALDWEEFKRAVLSIRPISVENMFYAGFSSRHMYMGYNYDYYDGFSLKSVVRCSLGDKYMNHSMPLDCGMDFGNMDSLVVGQEIGTEFYREFHILKSFHILTPGTYKEVAKEFVEYYKYHRKKILNYYYDRAANSNRNERLPLAEAFAAAIKEYDSEWTINLLSIGWGNVPHDQKHMLIKMILSESDPRYPHLRINEGNNKELILSIQMAPILIKDGRVTKDKRSEKKKLSDLPTKSTNFSDGFDYLLWGKYGHLLKASMAYKASVS